MSTVALGTPDSSRDTSGMSSVTSTPNLTIVSSPRVGTLIPNRIFVGGFPPITVEHELRVFFEKFGAVKEVKIIRDPSGTSKGYGFITYETDEEAKKMQERGEPLEFKGRHLNIGPAVRKASSQFKTYDIVPQGTVLCSYGVPYALQNGITLVAATPEAYAVAQPSQAALSYPIVMPQPVIYPSVPLAATAQAPTAATMALAGQHQSNNQAGSGQTCIPQHIQQNQSGPTSPSKMSTLAYVYDGGDEHVPKSAPQMATFQPNLVPVGGVIPNIGGLALNGMAQQSPQYRLATGAVASPMTTQYIYPNAATGYANMMQEVAPYPTNAYIHPEYAEVYRNGFDSYSEGRSSRFSPRKQTTQQQQSQQQQYSVSHTSTVSTGAPRYGSSTQRNGHRYSGKSAGSVTSTPHKVVTCAGYEFDPTKGDTKQPPGNVVTPPPTPITMESKS